MSGSSSSGHTPDSEREEQEPRQPEIPKVPELPPPPEIPQPELQRHGQPAKPPAPLQKGMRAMALASTIGLSLVIPPVLGYFAGRWLDGRFGTDPILSVAGLMVGIVLGFVEMVHVLHQIEREERKER
ncbi:MAG: AtpZ/AtpI family protein [Armatimonadetes bacterium]|nr:AtpZ/AtpI family protein [Armatimonadota bacterium]